MRYLVFFLLTAALAGCNTTENHTDSRLHVVATTGMIYDAVLNIADTLVKAEALMGPGVDPHLYKATQGDLKKLTESDVVLFNGLFLEGKMGEIFKKLSIRKPVIAVAEEIPVDQRRQSPVYNDAYDPHVWFDVNLWKKVVRTTSKALQEIDTLHADIYSKNTAAYLQRLDSLHAAVQSSLATIPEGKRILITAHDAFGYFGDAYGIEVRGLQGLSTLSEFGLKDISDLVDLIVNREIKAVFVETSVSEKAINAVVEGCRKRGHEVEIGGSLYSDAMGAWGSLEGTYIGMVDANVKTIVGHYGNAASGGT